MNHPHPSSLLLAAALALGGASAFAQASATDHASHHPAGAASATPAASPARDLTEGEIRRVDKAGGKLTIKHGAIKNLDMPPMTMVFQVRDKAQLERFKAGDKVRFRAENEKGQFLVTEIEPAP